MTDAVSTTSTGRDAFNFVIGEWIVSNRKRIDMLDPDCEEWVEFSSRGVHRALPGRRHPVSRSERLSVFV